MIQDLESFVALEIGINTKKLDWIQGAFVVVIIIVTNPSLVSQSDPHKELMGKNGDFFFICQKNNTKIFCRFFFKHRYEVVVRF